jgi:hypothetical protein
MDGYVDTCSAFGTLKVGNFAAIRKPLSHDVFAPSDLSGASFCGRCNRLLSVNQLCGFCDASDGMSGSLDAKENTSEVNTVLVSQLVGGSPGEVAFDNFVVGQVVPQSRMNAAATVEVEPSLASASGLSAFLHDSANPTLRTRDRSSDTFGGEAGSVELDRVVSLAVRQFDGHVFNLTTVDGYFSAEGLYTSNCSFAYNATHATAIDDASELVDGLMRRWTELVNDQTGAPLDGRVANDSLVLHGQVCFQPNGATFEPRTTFLLGGTGGFTMPPDRRVNAKLWGRRYAHPPNRPNDRSRLVPWKPTWAVPAYMVVNGQRMDVRKALELMKGAQADEVLDVAEGEPMPEQTLASEAEVNKAREDFAREQERRRAEAAAKRAKARKAK